MGVVRSFVLFVLNEGALFLQSVVWLDRAPEPAQKWLKMSVEQMTNESHHRREHLWICVAQAAMTSSALFHGYRIKYPAAW